MPHHLQNREDNAMLVRAMLSALVVLLATLTAAAQHTKDSLDTVKKALADNKAVLIDVREKSEWDEAHRRDARRLPLSSLKPKSLPKNLNDVLPKDKIAYLHCRAGNRSVKAAEILRKQGFDVRPLKDGYESLLTKGFPKAD